ncbi:MAG: hypothetical protein V3V78_04090, partial [Candidatus Woesearchaeota archaeon]
MLMYNKQFEASREVQDRLFFQLCEFIHNVNFNKATHNISFNKIPDSSKKVGEGKENKDLIGLLFAVNCNYMDDIFDEDTAFKEYVDLDEI